VCYLLQDVEKKRLSAPGDPKFNTKEDEFDQPQPRGSPPASNNMLTTTALEFIILVALMSIAAYLLAQAEAGAVGCYDPVCSMWHRGSAVDVQPTDDGAGRGRGGGHQRPENDDVAGPSQHPTGGRGTSDNSGRLDALAECASSARNRDGSQLPQDIDPIEQQEEQKDKAAACVWWCQGLATPRPQIEVPSI
jgi:hypothetical protein